jgi:hypothetical protein
MSGQGIGMFCCHGRRIFGRLDTRSVREGNVCAMGDEGPYTLAPDAPQTAGDERDLSFQARPTIQNARFLMGHLGNRTRQRNGSAEPFLVCESGGSVSHPRRSFCCVVNGNEARTMDTTTDMKMLAEMPLERLEEEISSFAGRLASSTATWLCWIAAYDAREGWAGWHAKSCAHWLNWRCGVSIRTAREHVRVARALEHFPLIRQTFLVGEISYSKVRAITRVAIPENEDYLVQLALDGTASQVERVCGGMRRRDRHEEEDAKNAIDNRYVKYVNNSDGTATITITAPVAQAKQAHTAILDRADAHVTQETGSGATRGDTIARLGGMPRVRAEIACAQLDGTIAATEMPTTDLLLIVDHDLFDSDAPDDAECTFDHERVAPLVAKRLACDARLQLAVEDAVGDALGIGRASRIVPRHVRRAMERRDKNMCRFPGCDATRRLHAHHVIHWLDGGPTELDNLVSLCHFHHQAVHEGGWNIESTQPGVFQFTDPTGFDHRVPQLNIKSARALPKTENGSAEPLAASGERADITFVTDVILGNTELRVLQS